jgi:hypothetical protein
MRPTHRSLRPLTAALTLSLMVAVSGCSSENPSYAPDPRPDSNASRGEPLFASDEEALEAAADAYRAYYAVVDAILNDGGADPERLRDVAIDSVYEFQNDGFTSYLDSGYRSVGKTVVDSPVLQQFVWPVTRGENTITIYACLDFSSTDVLDKDGISVVDSNRQVRYPMEASFAQKQDSLELIVAGEDSWTGTNFCV